MWRHYSEFVEEFFSFSAFHKLIVLASLITSCFFACRFMVRFERWWYKKLAGVENNVIWEQDVEAEIRPEDMIFDTPEPEILTDPTIAIPAGQMQAKIQIAEHVYDDVRSEAYTGFFGGLKHRQVNYGRKESHIVQLYLTPSEEDRAVILQYKLDELIVEDDPAFDEAYFEQQERNRAAFVRSAGGGRPANEIFQYGIDQARSMRHQIKLGQYFDNPFFKSFNTAHDAHLYAHKLRIEILPQIREAIEQYKQNPIGDTFTI